MKSAISIFTVLFFIVVSHYAHASDVKVTRAQNGAKDPGVQVIKEEEKKSTDKITAADLKDFATQAYDDRVLEFRRGDELITMVPLSDFWWSKERKAAFDQSQVLAEQLMKHWLESALNIRYNGSQSAVEQQIAGLTASEIRKEFAEQKLGGMPTRAEIIAAAGDAREAAKKLKEKAKFLVEYDELISTFDKYQDDNLEDTFLKEKLTPSAFMFVTSVKLPAKILEGMRRTKYFAGLATILDTSMTFTVSVRPWKVVKRNLNTGAKTTATYYETSTQAWAMKNFKTDVSDVKGPFRIGVGLLFGNFNRMANVHGGIIGGSYAFNFRKSIAGTDLLIPTHTQVRYGVMAGVVETLTGAMDLRNVAKHGYLMITKQFGYAAPSGRSANGDLGAVVNFNALTDRFSSFDKDAINGIIETALKEVPGADVVVRGDQVEILVPDETPVAKPTQQKQEIAPTPVNQLP